MGHIRPALTLILVAMVLLSPLGNNAESAEDQRDTKEIEIPDLSHYDAAVLRTLAENLYRKVAELETQVAKLGEEIQSLRSELRKKDQKLQELLRLTSPQANLRCRLN